MHVLFHACVYMNVAASMYMHVSHPSHHSAGRDQAVLYVTHNTLGGVVEAV